MDKKINSPQEEKTKMALHVREKNTLTHRKQRTEVLDTSLHTQRAHLGAQDPGSRTEWTGNFGGLEGEHSVSGSQKGPSFPSGTLT